MMARDDYYYIHHHLFTVPRGYVDSRPDIRYMNSKIAEYLSDIITKYDTHFPLYNEARLNYAAYPHSRARGTNCYRFMLQ